MAVLLCLHAGLAAQTATTPETAVRAAVERIVGASAQITVVNLRTDVAPDPGLSAEPEAAARFGKASRFVLFIDGERRGLAVATVSVEALAARAARSIARDEAIGADAVNFTVGALPPVLMRALPAPDAVIGLTARRDIAPGEVFIDSVLRRLPLVRSGDEVTATLRVGAVTVTSLGYASGSGHLGDLIRVSQPHSSRLLKGRITGAGAVEILE